MERTDQELVRIEKANRQKRRADAPGSLTHRPGSCLLFTGFLPGPS